MPHLPLTLVQLPSVSQKSQMSSFVLLVKNRGSKNPQTLDAVGVQPTASKVFALYGKGEHFRCQQTPPCNVPQMLCFQEKSIFGPERV